MRMLRITVLLAATAMTALASPARAAYTMSPAGPTDTRMSFVPPVTAVFVVDNAKGQIAMCCPDNKDNKIQVVCTPATKLP
jgi:hypothetical protein